MGINADICGWRKYIEAPLDTKYKGHCFIVIQPPIDILVKPTDIVKDDFGVMKIMLHEAGYDSIGVPIYKYNP